MESLVPVINQLQDICNNIKVSLELDLPQIVVVGAQSSGKSSVIEGIVKREFLPRGEGLVTRRPLEIRLIKISEDINDENSINGDWVRFSHTDRIFTDFAEVRDEIERETERVCGSNFGISHEIITLSVYSKNVVNLTLIDLPGLIKVPTGSQPKDIEIQVRNLVTRYISNPNSIILAVAEGTSDIVTSEAIKLAHEADPEGKRTFAVLTKLDMIPEGTNRLEELTGQRLKMRLGIIGVVNRTQKEIIEKKPIEKAIEDEAKFFRRRYPLVAEKCGQPYLLKRLTQLLMNHIRDCLPDLKLKVSSLISKHNAKLKSYGEPVSDKAQTIFDVIARFYYCYCNTIKGGNLHSSRDKLIGGARIEYIFHTMLDKGLSQINPLDKLDGQAILTAARNHAGVGTEIIVPNVFEFLVKEQIERLEGPILDCVDLVYQEMKHSIEICNQEVQPELLRFPVLRDKINQTLTRILDERLPITREGVSRAIKLQLAYIDTEDPKFRDLYLSNCVATSTRDTTKPNGLQSESLAAGDASSRYERDQKVCDDIALKIKAYFELARDDIKRIVPKDIMLCMVNHIKFTLHSALTKELYRPDMFDLLLSESDEIVRRRNETKEKLEALTKASEIIGCIDKGRQ